MAKVAPMLFRKVAKKFLLFEMVVAKLNQSFDLKFKA